MDAERYVIRASTSHAVVGSSFTLTLAPAALSTKESQKGGSNSHEIVTNESKQDEIEEDLQRKSESDLDEKLWAFFKAIAGEDGELDPFELQSVLGQVFKRDFGVKQFNLESCRSMVVMADADRSGRLTFAQFKVLFQWIMDLRKMYKSFEEKRGQQQNWDMESDDVKEALGSLGFEISNSTIDKIIVRYLNRNKRINFDDFVQICCRLKAVIQSYFSYQKVGEESFDNFLMQIVYT